MLQLVVALPMEEVPGEEVPEEEVPREGVPKKGVPGEGVPEQVHSLALQFAVSALELKPGNPRGPQFVTYPKEEGGRKEVPKENVLSHSAEIQWISLQGLARGPQMRTWNPRGPHVGAFSREEAPREEGLWKKVRREEVPREKVLSR